MLLRQLPACLLLASAFFLSGQLLQTPATVLHGDLTSFRFVFKVVYCPSWSFEVTRGQQIQWILGAVRGGRRKDGHGTRLVFAFPLWECGDILFKVSGIGSIVHFCFLGQRGLKLMGFVTQICWFVVQLLYLKKLKEENFCFDFF